MIAEITYTMTRKQIERDEGRKRKLYRDDRGIWSAGVGRNMQQKGLSEKEIDFMLDNDTNDAIADSRKLVPNFDQHSPARQAVIINMAFNLGYNKLSKFKGFLRALEIRDYQLATIEMKDSDWHKQVKGRAERLCKQMESGQWVG